VKLALTLIAIAIAVPALAQQYPLIPDPHLTPGEIDSTDQADVCGLVGGKTYSQRHRGAGQAIKDRVAQAYGFARHDGHKAEDDHRLPLSLGGSDGIKNRWEQGHGSFCGSEAKDKLEDQAWHQVCKDHTMTLADAQALFLGSYWLQLPGCIGEMMAVK
jgi:hypothetical protein